LGQWCGEDKTATKADVLKHRTNQLLSETAKGPEMQNKDEKLPLGRPMFALLLGQSQKGDKTERCA
jgi:hypothetical protein